jgi:hypothetical protein
MLTRIQHVATTYSKAGHAHGDTQHQPFEPDSQTKEEHATPAIKEAARFFLNPSFQALEAMRLVSLQ